MERFLSFDTTRLGRPDVPPSSDAVNEELVEGTPASLKADLVEILGENLVYSAGGGAAAEHGTDRRPL